MFRRRATGSGSGGGAVSSPPIPVLGASPFSITSRGAGQKVSSAPPSPPPSTTTIATTQVTSTALPEDDLLSSPSENKKTTTAAPERKFVYSILTSKEHHDTRIKSVMNTWGRHANIAFIASDQKESSLPLVQDFEVKGKDMLGQKAMTVLAKMCPYDADFYVMTDDDTFVIVHNLEYLFSSNFNPNSDVYAGYSLKHMKPEIIGGGGGIVFSKGAMKKFCEVAENPNHSCSYKRKQTTAGDAAIVYCMQALGIGATHQDGFNPFPINQMIDQPKNWCTETWWFPKHIKCPPIGGAATFHYVPPGSYLEYYWWSYNFTQLAKPSPRGKSPYV